MGILQTARDLYVQVTDDKGTGAWSSALKLDPLPTGERHANLRSQGRGLDTSLLANVWSLSGRNVRGLPNAVPMKAAATCLGSPHTAGSGTRPRPFPPPAGGACTLSSLRSQSVDSYVAGIAQLGVATSHFPWKTVCRACRHGEPYRPAAASSLRGSWRRS